MSFLYKGLIIIKGTCDNCGKVFNVKYREKRHPKKIIETYFNCKHCKKKYFCFATDSEVRQLQEEIIKVDSPFIRSAMQNKINEKMKKLKERLA